MHNLAYERKILYDIVNNLLTVDHCKKIINVIH